ncbi:MAG: penicillin-binding protein 2, partial [Clostridia bacterium]|nr:penicillin-binding protein 2 [Clostridia bacterium]
ISTSPVREFVNGSTAVHILGRTGKIYKEEYDELADKDYKMNDIIGKQGIEKYCESYLRGIDGLSGVEQSVDQSRVKIVESVAPKKGNNVILTIDVNVQKAAERALAETIQYIRYKSASENGNGADANCGAIAAVDVNSGDIIAIASYPPYDPYTFDEDYAKLSSDRNLPMFNRAIGGAYEPGSTFKMLTAIAALEENVITPEDSIEDLGIYKYYEDYQPACWIYRSKKTTHGFQNVTEALENSCNYFFYDIGRRTTIEGINKYAKIFGLGESTGIELTSEENKGLLTSPEQREAEGKAWNPGDVLQVSIGQSRNMFTPLQLANYLATLVNGGTRYKTHLIKSVRDSETGEVLFENMPEIADSIEIKEENYKAVMQGMKNVIELGTASSVFDDFPIPVGGKTGTAEVTGGSDNAIFLGFAPFDNPTIAVCAVIEHGAHGTNAGLAVKTVLNSYFNSASEARLIEQKNVLTR